MDRTVIARGIDVSQHQGYIDWQVVKAAGADFAIIRLGIGTNGQPGDNCEKDEFFRANMDGAINAGINVGKLGTRKSGG
jgi:GH25 family lysozyme M1 (1,4-beta-N-acetylmuramidase)